MIAATWLGCSHLPPFHKVQMTMKRMMPLEMKNCGFYLVYSSKVSRFFGTDYFCKEHQSFYPDYLYITFLLLTV